MALKLPPSASVFIRAGLVAPLAGGVWCGFAFAILMAFSGEAYQAPATFLTLVGLSSLYGGLVIFVLTWTLGLVWHVIACAMNWRNAASYVSAGAGVGAFIGCAVALLATSANGSELPQSPSTAAALLLMGLLGSTGAITAGVGWLIRRPDRDAANPDTSAS